LTSRPAQWEVDAVRMMIRLSEETGCKIHIVHLSAADALEDIHQAKERGVPLTVETCPHYLTFTAEDIPDGATLFKCAPPIRKKENRERLWKALEIGTIDCIVSDHSPCMPKLKELEKGDFKKAWGGISSIQFSLPAVWTEMKKRHLPLSRLSTWMSCNTALLAGLAERKGSLQVGFDADFIVWDPNAKQVIESSHIYHRHSPTPYEGYQFYGTVLKTFVRGNLVYNAAAPSDKFSELPMGKLLSRKQRRGK
ncbi:MAG: amidohydrolase family protein, partial [Bdellovibrionia bacterium]